MKSVPLSQFMPYGAPELLGASRRHMMQALMISSALCIATFAAVGLVLSRMPPPVVIVVPDVIPGIHDLLPPPTVVHEQLRVAAVVKPAKIAIPIPVPAVDPHPLVTTDSGSQPQVDTGLRSLGDGEPDHGAGPRGTEAPPAPPKPGEYVYYDELPVVVKQVEPEYPDIGRVMGVSGEVRVQLLVDTDGRVRNALIIPHYSIPVLNEAALDAGRRWIFKPAKANGHPVAVWVAVPFNFKLH